MKRLELEKVATVVAALAELIPFFPKDKMAQQIITAEIHSFCANEEQLNWFAQASIRQFTKWTGVPELRALFATRFQPADGIAPRVDLPGMSAGELEAEYHRREMRENDERMESYRREALSAPAEDRAPFLLPEVKRLM